MSQKSIELLEKISGLVYVPITAPANLVKVTFGSYIQKTQAQSPTIDSTDKFTPSIR